MTPTTVPLCPRELSQKGLVFIAGFEGFRAKAYNDAAKPTNCTIGYGHVLHSGPCRAADEALEWSKAQALGVLKRDSELAAHAVTTSVRVALTQPQYDALVSFTFNCGTGAFTTSHLLSLVNAHEFAKVPGELLKWVHAGSVVLPGLVNRRRAEGELFVHGTY